MGKGRSPLFVWALLGFALLAWLGLAGAIGALAYYFG